MADNKKIPIRPGNGADAAENDESRNARLGEDGPLDEVLDPFAPDLSGTAGPVSAPEEGGPATLEELTAERDAYRDSLLRLKAEFENYRKRSQRELAEAGGRARAAVLAEFLPVIDNLDRALNAAEHHEESKVLEGVHLTHSLFAQLLRREGVESVDPLGQPFDPHVHEAMMAAPSPEPEGVITAVLEPGYVMGDQVLRPAKVAVSSGPPEARE